MDLYEESEELSDPFQVGEDELDDDPPTPVARFHSERSFSRENENEITIGSASEDEEEDEEEEEEEDPENPLFSPPPPPKDATAFPKPQLIGEAAGLLSPNLFLPIPEVSPGRVIREMHLYTVRQIL